MSIIRPFEATDLLKFNRVNADRWTATYGTGYYASYLAIWPDWSYAVQGAFDPSPSVRAYMIAKHEPFPPDPQHHAHLTALSIMPSWRGLGLAGVLMAMLERLGGPAPPPPPPGGKKKAKAASTATTTATNGEGEGEGEAKLPTEGDAAAIAAGPSMKDGVDAWFVDLFVRCNNTRAVDMYEHLGYSVFRRVVDYYHGMEGPNSTRDELDGFDMRKSLPKDTEGKYTRSNGRDILVGPDQVWA